MRIIVVHGSYGCDSGCCGHAIEVDGVQREFEFMHPYAASEEERRSWAEDLIAKHFGEKHIQDLDWDKLRRGGRLGQ